MVNPLIQTTNKNMQNTTTTTTNEINPLEGLVSCCCGQDHKIGEPHSVSGREKIGYCSLCDEPVRFISQKDYYENDLGDGGGGEDRYLDSSWEDRAEMGCW
jgi:hypothetical protein